MNNVKFVFNSLVIENYVNEVTVLFSISNEGTVSIRKT